MKNATRAEHGRTVNDRRGFMLIELVVVIAMLLIMAGFLMEATRTSFDEGRRIQCLSNLRQMAQAASLYADNHSGWYPPAYRNSIDGNRIVAEAWDFTTRFVDGNLQAEAGLIWQGQIDVRIQQCPSLVRVDGIANWNVDPYTGYNYNTSYVGAPTDPAHALDVAQPAATAMFGDGQWSGGANKFMRSPLPSPTDIGFSGRLAGTQGYRHRELTNVAFADGHAVAHADRYSPEGTVPGTGFLGEDNTLYDLQ